jgi:hypothetical protein
VRPPRAGSGLPAPRPPDEPVPGPVVRLPSGRPLTSDVVRRFNEASAARRANARPRVTLVYRTKQGGLRKVAEKVLDGGRARPLAGHEDTILLEDGLAVVDDDTLVYADGGPDSGALLREALERARDERGFDQARLASAERAAGIDDPLVVAAGDLGLARGLVDEPDFERARSEVPYLSAIRAAGAALKLEDDEVEGAVEIATDGDQLDHADLPLGPAGDLELPETAGIAGASRDQSRTTTFASRVVRSLFADSRFVRAVDKAERELGIGFEDEVLRQFDCPSVSVFDPGDQSFAARSCLSDPERMRRLLPRLAPHLPGILTAMQGLGDEGLLGLLLVAPDAPLTPSALADLAAIAVRPFGDGSDREQLYEVTGLRDDPGSQLAQAGPERVVFGMIGDSFVVGSTRELARSAARLRTRRASGEAASGLRLPFEQAFAPRSSDDTARVIAEVFGDLEVTFSATPDATTARLRLDYER